jgi:GH15 family glucan-1,4-alpha-glucosidase
MNFNQLLDYMYEHHRLRRQKDIAKYFGVTTQAISNWKRSDTIPSKFAIKLQVEKPTNYVELVESLSQVLISLNKNIKDIKAMQSISKISAQCFSDGLFLLIKGKPVIQLTHISGDWEKLTGYTIKETIKMKNIIGKIQIIDNEKEYINRMYPSGLTEATHEGYWTLKHRNGHLLKIHGISWVDYTENTFKSAFSESEKLN